MGGFFPQQRSGGALKREGSDKGGIRIKFVAIVHWFKRRWIPRDVRKAVEMQRCTTTDPRLLGKVVICLRFTGYTLTNCVKMHRGRPSVVTRPKEPKNLWISCEGHIGSGLVVHIPVISCSLVYTTAIKGNDARQRQCRRVKEDRDRDREYLS